MLVHTACNSNVYVDRTREIRILSSFIIVDSGIRLTTGTIRQEKEKDFKLSFVCSTCGPIEVSDISGNCDNCGDIFSLRDLFRLTKVPGYYCSKCCSEIDPTSVKRTLQSIVERKMI